MTSIVFVIENLSYIIENLLYNWSIIIYRDSNKNSTKVFCSIKHINKKAVQIYECCAYTLLHTYLLSLVTREIFFWIFAQTLTPWMSKCSGESLVYHRDPQGAKMERRHYSKLARSIKVILGAFKPSCRI